MRIFLTSANSFIGDAIASALTAEGHTVRGLVRDQGKVSAVAAHGIEAAIGAHGDTALLQNEARASDGVVNAANSDHRGAVKALIFGLVGSDKPLVHTSGTSIEALACAPTACKLRLARRFARLHSAPGPPRLLAQGNSAKRRAQETEYR